MNITQAIASVRNYLDDPNSNKYDNTTIAQNFDLAARSMFRDAVKAGSDFHSLYLNLPQSLAVQLFDKAYQWKLPTWAHKIHALYARSSADIVGQTDISAYVWAPGSSITPSLKIEKGAPENHDGWEWDGNYTLTLWRSSTATSLTAFVAKVPAPCFKGAIGTVIAGNKTQFILPAANLLGQIELESGVYMNAEFMCTSTASVTGNNLGEVRRCIDSTSRDVTAVPGLRSYVLTFDRAWNDVPAANDVFETVTPFPETFALYQILRTVEATVSKKANLELIRAITPSMLREEKAFLEGVTPMRDSGGPVFYRSRTRSTAPRDPNRLYWPYPQA